MPVAQERAAALVEAIVPGMLLVRDGQIQGAQEQAPVQFRREPDEAPNTSLHEFYCRLLRATDDEAFRQGQAVRLEPISAWPGNTTHEGILARLWVGQHRQLRLAIANLSDEPAQAYIPLALPEFAGKTVRLEDQLDDVVYDRPGDDVLSRGLFVDMPAYGGHLFRVTRQTPTGQRRRNGPR
jgi:hypothetical protein